MNFFPGMIISIPFLLATLFVYAVLPEKRNLHGKCLMSYVSSLMLAYCFLVFIQLNTDIINETPACTAIGTIKTNARKFKFKFNILFRSVLFVFLLGLVLLDEYDVYRNLVDVQVSFTTTNE